MKRFVISVGIALVLGEGLALVLVGVLGGATLADNAAAECTAIGVSAMTFTVNADDDVDDGICDSAHCSLREAINAANANSITDTIAFNIPGPGSHTIQPTSALPRIYSPVIIDGYTQPGTSPNTNPPELGLNTVLKIELDGSNAGDNADGLWINGRGSTVRGLAINRFRWGIALDSGGDNTIEGNFIGTDITGTTALGNGFGVYGFNHTTNNVVGGLTAAAANLVSGNGYSGVMFESGAGNIVQGNLVGTDVSGVVGLGNKEYGGVRLDNANNCIISDNIVGYNGAGITLYWSANSTIAHNEVKLNSNQGIAVSGPASGNAILSNHIVSNGRWGILLDRATGHTIMNNVILSNGSSGIYAADSIVNAQNDIIANNTSTEGVYVSGGSLTARHWTLVNNGDYAITATNSSMVVLTNTIVASHTLVGLWGSSIAADHTLFFNNGTACSGGAVCINNLSGDPKFINPATGNYHINLESAALDKGVDAGVRIDVDGDPRPQGSGYDIGADETGLVVTKQAAPDPVQAGSPLTYTIRVTNTSNVDLHATITDTLPAHVTPGGILTWTNSIVPGDVWTQTIVVTVTRGYSDTLTNRVQITTLEGAVGETQVIVNAIGYQVYLPIVLK